MVLTTNEILITIYITIGVGFGFGSIGKNDSIPMSIVGIVFGMLFWPLGFSFYLTRFLRKGAR